VATLREIRGRIGGVKNTQKITKAMKMVAAAKLRRAQDAIIAARPYSRKMKELLGQLVAEGDFHSNPLLSQREVKNVLIVVVTADRGLCGAFNSNLIKTANEHIHRNYSQLLETPDALRIIAVGKKGFDYFNKRNVKLYSKHVGIFSSLEFGTAQEIVGEMTEGYLLGEFDKVEVIYNEFKSVISQKAVVEQFLPIPSQALAGDHPSATLEYIYEPSSKTILADLLPKHLNFQMWRVLLESNAAEQGAKMTAMSNATENAKELLRALTLSYNKARQAGITKELLEIVSGAEALKKAS
jgi:F-type H+-transporting ATPase subunit gamma